MRARRERTWVWRDETRPTPTLARERRRRRLDVCLRSMSARDGRARSTSAASARRFSRLGGACLSCADRPGTGIENISGGRIATRRRATNATRAPRRDQKHHHRHRARVAQRSSTTSRARAFARGFDRRLGDDDLEEARTGISRISPRTRSVVGVVVQSI